MDVDIAQLGTPDVIETLSFETLLAELKADLVSRYPDIANTIDLESEPTVKLLEVAAYRELQLRARYNDEARALLLAEHRLLWVDRLAIFRGRVFPGLGDLSRDRTKLAFRVSELREKWDGPDPGTETAGGAWGVLGWLATNLATSSLYALTRSAQKGARLYRRAASLGASTPLAIGITPATSA